MYDNTKCIQMVLVENVNSKWVLPRYKWNNCWKCHQNESYYTVNKNSFQFKKKKHKKFIFWNTYRYLHTCTTHRITTCKLDFTLHVIWQKFHICWFSDKIFLLFTMYWDNTKLCREKKKNNKTHPYRMYLTYSILCKLKCHRIKLSLSDFFIVKITNIYRI